jgi:hypothetical protein
MRILIISFFIFCQILGQAQNLITPGETIKIDKEQLVKTKIALAAKESNLSIPYQALLNKANSILNIVPKSVMDKTDIPPSGSKHDYVSLAPYWWPDPTKPNGLPYIKKDGLINPEVKNFPDKEHMPALSENVYLLGIAYYLSGNEVYAQKATDLLTVWFMDTATRMNPNLNFAQMVKGINNGRGTGIIDTRHFIYAIDGIQLIENSKYWTKEKNKSTKKWFSEFLTWLQYSANGIEEMQTKNNHGVWYDAQTLAIALYVDSTQLAKRIVERSLQRLDQQSNAEHLFPLELERTNSLHYSNFNLNAFSVIAQLAKNLGINYWETETIHKHSLHKSYLALLPYLKNERAWTLQEITPYKYEEGYSLLYYAQKNIDCKDCLLFINQNSGNKSPYHLLQLL